MRMLCLWRQRVLSHLAVLGRPLPPDSPLESHVLHCAACRRCWEDLIHLRMDLPSALNSASPSPSFLRDVMQRLPDRSPPQPYPLRPAALALAAGVVILAGGVFKTLQYLPALHSPAPPEKEMRSHPLNPGEVDAAPTEKSPLISMAADGLPWLWENRGLPADGFTKSWKEGSAALPTLRRVGRTSRPTAGSVFSRVDAFHRKRHRHSPSSKSREQTRFAQLAGKETLRRRAGPSWREWGRWYEAWGDYGSAAEAYGRAYAEQPEPALAYAAGMDSERAGDVTQALEYYAGVLSTSNDKILPKSQPQKGTEL